MPAFPLICWLDTYDLATSLRQHVGLFQQQGGGLRIIPVRGFKRGTEEADEHFVSYQQTAKWVELKNTLRQLKAIGDGLAGEIVFGRVFLEMLDPGTLLPWGPPEITPYRVRYQRIHLVLRTNPGAVVLAAHPSGVEHCAGIQGQVFGWPTGIATSAVNLGGLPRVHLVVDFKRSESREQTRADAANPNSPRDNQ